MDFTFNVSVQVTRESGKFASRDEVEEQLLEAIAQADPGSVDGVGADGDTTYVIEQWEVTSTS